MGKLTVSKRTRPAKAQSVQPVGGFPAGAIAAMQSGQTGAPPPVLSQWDRAWITRRKNQAAAQKGALKVATPPVVLPGGTGVAAAPPKTAKPPAQAMLGTTDLAYSHSLDHHLEFFSKAGSLFSGRKGGSHAVSALQLLKACWSVNNAELLGMKLLFWLRDPRGGAGNRSGFRDIINFLATDSRGAKWLLANLAAIPAYGRWDDLVALFGTPLESHAAALWAANIRNQDHLACKWAKRDMRPLQRSLHVNEAGLRKLIVPPRSTTVEVAMCKNDWTSIEYAKIPSKAMAAYTEAFKRHDPAGFAKFKKAVVKGEAKINASVLFPYDCMRTAIAGDAQTADLQFDALPNYMDKESPRKIMSIVDTSGSMDVAVAGQVTNLMIALSLGLYCSDRLGSSNPFYRRYMEFSSSAALKDWRGKKFSAACRSWDGEVGYTNIGAALDLLLNTAVIWRVPRDQMIDTVLVISDMQFNGGGCPRGAETTVEYCLNRWEQAGYKRPAVVYWCLSGTPGNRATVFHKDIALISGFSPAILAHALGGKIDPLATLNKAIAKYVVHRPA